MTVLTQDYHINKHDFLRAGEASIHIKKLLKTLDVDPQVIRRVAICGYEGEMNVVMHGGDGTVQVKIKPEIIELLITDNGPGIPDIPLAMTKGYSTATDKFREMGFGAGMGLPNMKKNADRFSLESVVDEGTTVRMIFHHSLPEKES